MSYYLISLGCAKNQVDSERINGSMASAGYINTQSPEDADIIIINTCGFITEAKEESIEIIFDALETQRPAVGKNVKTFSADGAPPFRDFGRKVAVVGCLSQRYREDLARDIPEIDYMYGIPDDRFVARMSEQFCVATAPVNPLREPLLPGLSYSYLKIADGCSNNCSYCAIPLIRGPHVSYAPGRILDDARREAARGVKELIVVAQDISAYRHNDVDLHELVSRLSCIPGVEWIRLMYCHPDHLDDRIIAILEREEKIVPYIDIPFQHVSAPLIRSMGRSGDAETYRALAERLRKRVPHIRIRSTFMVGYPGETDSCFEELIDFLNNTRLDRVGAFVFSPEEGTRACGLGDTVPVRVKKERYHRLMALQRKISEGRLADMTGSIVRVLVEERVDDTTWAGRTEYDAPEVDGIFYLTGFTGTVNSIVKARVAGALEYDLFGEVIVEEDAPHT
ncbi:MAG: ribosomal protein S12 methylthiotransferase RimO [Spirochaetes bacterium RBG_13_51_14]|nr:MAG: ribosomal protein S12 methylthiotransferase RimO [Spirochaetes bacterium RBG_13_51_14]